MSIYELAALSAALAWAITGIVASGSSKSPGAFTFSRIRMAIVFVRLSGIATLTGGWATVATDTLGLIVLSGLVGIFLGDTALFLILNRLGPRATGVLFAANAPITVLLGWALPDEVLAPLPLAGTLIALVGIVLAITFGKHRRASLSVEGNSYEAGQGPVWIGIACGVFAASCQAARALLIRPVMVGDDGTPPDPIAVSAVRVGIAAHALQIARLLPIRAMQRQGPLTAKTLGLTALSGVLAMGIGMTLLVFALSGGDAGIVATLSAMTSVLILSLLWLLTRQTPRLGSWIGAALTVVGSALIFVE